MMDSHAKIPNNVNLSEDPKLQRALEKWLPDFQRWWLEMGPEGFQGQEVYLRTAIAVDAKGWAHFDHVKMPDYRWGIFLAEQEGERRIGFGDFAGQPAWQEVPGELRGYLRRLIVTQGDTEPASVEQQRQLGSTAPSLYDLRNLFQVNVEEGRHLWAMVYLLQRYFGRDGREEADALLERRSGNPDKPRILGAFNAPIRDWLSFYMFTMFTDRDGKYQLLALAESGFEPLARTTRFMLTEEAHHMFVGETGVRRVVQRSAELLRQDPNGDVRAQGGIDLETIQKYIHLWYSLSADLFGGEISTNAADYFASGLKGRYQEELEEDHRALDGTYRMSVPDGERLREQDVPLRNAMNEILRDRYIDDCQRGVDRWNVSLEKAGLDYRFRLPSRRFHRHVGLYAGHHYSPEGDPLTAAEWEARRETWLPSAADLEYVASLMRPVHERGKISQWVAPPPKGIHGKPFDFEYVRL
ncbi:MAG TPA: benzoyl-CoA 2,3-epoxidase subunit BoxB [Candidatus Krumholzibacteria bacterium]|nr:benzoyl-CoA 2,3-epoxidase subunit BoxB [Candidatus Krumholzibacteria bacterium]